MGDIPFSAPRTVAQKMLLMPDFPSLPQNAGWWEETGTGPELGSRSMSAGHRCLVPTGQRVPGFFLL